MSHSILVVDSGIGGLSICQHVIEQFPDLNLHYLSDNEAYPYGTKDRNFLDQRVPEIINRLKLKFDAIIIACNTASTVVLPTLREQFSIPVIGVVPAIKTAANITQSGCYALLATPGTVNRDYTKQLINEFSSGQTVVSIGSRELVDLVESYYLQGKLDNEQLENILKPLFNDPNAINVDCVVLGCTHFPLIRPQLEKLAPHWRWLDSGPAIAARLQHLLNLNSADSSTQSGERSFWATSADAPKCYSKSSRFAAQLKKMGFNQSVNLL